MAELRKWLADRLIWWGFRLDPERLVEDAPPRALPYRKRLYSS